MGERVFGYICKFIVGGGVLQLASNQKVSNYEHGFLPFFLLGFGNIFLRLSGFRPQVPGLAQNPKTL
eukprot:2912103-Amphidinium_carterae.1